VRFRVVVFRAARVLAAFLGVCQKGEIIEEGRELTWAIILAILVVEGVEKSSCAFLDGVAGQLYQYLAAAFRVDCRPPKHHFSAPPVTDRTNQHLGFRFDICRFLVALEIATKWVFISEFSAKHLTLLEWWDFKSLSTKLFPRRRGSG